ncbi:MAG: hypothetical protein IAF02_11465 [Anaerolineae bacterium]|nr:hypothetical protein [Anaerolineae bacterium]
MGFLFIAGAIIGFLFTNFPRLIQYPNVDKYSPEEFVQSFPEVKWIKGFLTNVPLLWFVFYGFLFVILPQILEGPVLLFSITFWFLGGISLIDGFFEIISYISPLRSISMNRGGSSRFLGMALGDSVRRYGVIRTGLILIVGFILPVVTQVIMNYFDLNMMV